MRIITAIVGTIVAAAVGSAAGLVGEIIAQRAGLTFWQTMFLLFGEGAVLLTCLNKAVFGKVVRWARCRRQERRQIFWVVYWLLIFVIFSELGLFYGLITGAALFEQGERHLGAGMAVGGFMSLALFCTMVPKPRRKAAVIGANSTSSTSD